MKYGMKEIHICTIRFATGMARNELPLFRGAVINSLPHDNVLFHNHLDDKFRYSYPLIQYKLLDRKAAIVCIGEGSEAIKDYFSNFSSEIRLGDRQTALILESSASGCFPAGISGEYHEYTLSHWLPLNKDNYGEWLASRSLAEKSGILEKILTGNILSFGKGTGIQFDDKVECILTDISGQYPAIYKGVRMMAFDITFSANVTLPDYIGLGKGVSIGNGILKERHR